LSHFRQQYPFLYRYFATAMRDLCPSGRKLHRLSPMVLCHREYRKPCGENILCGIDVSVMVCPTLWTVPLSNIKRQFIDNVTALSTAFRARKPSVNFNQRPTGPKALVLQLTNQLRPACISNSCTKFSVLQHILYSQVLDSNRLVFAYQSSGQLVEEIFASIGNAGLNTSNRNSRFLS